MLSLPVLATLQFYAGYPMRDVVAHGAAFLLGWTGAQVEAVGASLTWLAGLGPMTFSYAFVFNDSEIDRVEQFQFELGRTF